MILITTLKLVFDEGTGTIISVLVFSFPVYFILALHKFYGQSWGKVVLKFLGVSFIYNAMLWMAVIVVFIKSMV
jgi:hypothetical protein